VALCISRVVRDACQADDFLGNLVVVFGAGASTAKLPMVGVLVMVVGGGASAAPGAVGGICSGLTASVVHCLRHQLNPNGGGPYAGGQGWQQQDRCMIHAG
jgi:hypothetical protein